MPDINIKELKEEFDSLSTELTNPELISEWEKFQEISKRRALVERIIKAAEELENIKNEIEENRQILSSQEDDELNSMAEQELSSLVSKQKSLQKALDKLLSGDSGEIPKAVIIEIRPGAGGDEASLFAHSLLEMYTKYAALKGWKAELLNLTETEVGGVREASLEIAGDDVFESLEHEAGVHRVQRIPTTEKAGRVHTSTASVALLAKAEKSQLQINPADIEVEFTGSSGPGGQNVNKRQTAVRVTHKPSGLVVLSQTSRNQQKNRESAMALLEAKLLQQKQEEEQKEVSGERKAQIGTADRSEKIRTYNFPQDRITDHRIKKSWSNIEKILQGELDEITEALLELDKT